MFIHSGFRTGSTWLRSCFRSHPGILPYGEIFHENLASLRTGEVPRHFPGKWENRHPAGAPYYIEYIPLLQPEGGIRHFDGSMAFERFLPPAGFDGELTASETAYIQSLIDHAQSVGKQALMTDTRSLGRSAAIKKAFGGRHVLLYRNLFYQWCSYSQAMLTGNGYFLNTTHEILSHAQQDAFLHNIHQIYPGPYRYPDKNALAAFFFMHMYLYCRNADVVDLVVDLDQLVDPAYRRQTEERLSEFSGISVDLSSYNQGICFADVDRKDLEEIRELLNSVPDLLLADNPPEAGRAMIEKCKTDFLTAFEQYLFYAGFLTRHVFGRGGLREQMTARQEEAVSQAASERDQALAEAAGLRGRTEELEGIENGLRREGDALRADADNLRGRVRELEGIEDGLRREGNVLRGDGEVLRGRIAELERMESDLRRMGETSRADGDVLRARIAELERTESDLRRTGGALRTRVGELEGIEGDLRREGDSLRADADVLRARIVELEGLENGLRQDVASLRADVVSLNDQVETTMKDLAATNAKIDDYRDRERQLSSDLEMARAENLNLMDEMRGLRDYLAQPFIRRLLLGFAGRRR